MVRQALVGVVNEIQGDRVQGAPRQDIEVAGKTGTAQVAERRAPRAATRPATHAWFVGFAPAGRPEDRARGAGRARRPRRRRRRAAGDGDRRQLLRDRRAGRSRGAARRAPRRREPRPPERRRRRRREPPAAAAAQAPRRRPSRRRPRPPRRRRRERRQGRRLAQAALPLRLDADAVGADGGGRWGWSTCGAPSTSGRRNLFTQQISWLGLGAAVFLGVAAFDYRNIARLGYVLHGVGVALLLGVLVFGKMVGGGRRWFDLGAVPPAAVRADAAADHRRAGQVPERLAGAGGADLAPPGHPGRSSSACRRC